MRGPTLALIIGIVVVIATVIALQQISQAQTKTATPTQPTTPTTPSTCTALTTGIKYDPQKGRQYFSEIGCDACHSIKSLGISGGAVGPDKTLLGSPGAGGLDK